MSILINNAFKGFIPQAMPTTDISQIAQGRNTVVRAWNTTYPSQIKNKPKPINTPFRIVNNAGDLYCRQNYSCGGPCQSTQSRPGLYGLSQRFGSSHSVCDGSGVTAATCNPKYVYDGSDYTTYLRNKAILKAYSDKSYGGDQNNASQVSVNAIKRY
jgi:hypothetical protein